MTNQILEIHCFNETKGSSDVMEVNPIQAK